MAASFDYDLTLQLTDGSEVKLNPEEHGWAEPERLAQVRVWSIIPRVQGLPPIVVQIPEGAKPIFKSRVYGKGFGPGASKDGITFPSFRAYAVGWHDTVSHWIWVLPNGSIEVGDDPIYAELLLNHMMQQLIQEHANDQAPEG